jgi:hypothetical protein
VNLIDYVLVHKDDHSHMKCNVKELEAQIANLMDLTSTKQVWAAEMSLKNFGDVIKAGDLLADRKQCTCSISIMVPCSDCSKAIANWKTVTRKEPR